MRMWERTYRWTLVGVLAAVLVLTNGLVGNAGSAGTGQGIPDRVVFPLSGIFAQDGANYKQATDYWAETVNNQGGIKVKGVGYPIELIYYDDEGSPVKSAQLLERQITVDKVDLILRWLWQQRRLCRERRSGEVPLPVRDRSRERQPDLRTRVQVRVHNP